MRILVLVSALCFCLLAWDVAVHLFQSDEQAPNFDPGLAAGAFATSRASSSNEPDIRSYRVVGEMAPIIKSGIAEQPSCPSRKDA